MQECNYMQEYNYVSKVGYFANAMRCKSQAPFLSSKTEVVRCESNE